ncbi:MAG: hypothetical protein U1D06_12485, partial [Paracoccaceae bacterium]|nr:hypothetical protein [Paracoccaceae bacterium]
MSDAMTSGEIEDVLSSIRRLVSEDLRPGARSPGSVSGSVSGPVPGPVAERNKLLLTPALRVVPGEATQPPMPVPIPVPIPVVEACGDPSSGPSARLQPPAIDAVLSDPDHATSETVLAPDLPQDTTGSLDVVVASIGAAVDAHPDAHPEEWEPETGDSAIVDLPWRGAQWADPEPESGPESDVEAEAVDDPANDPAVQARNDQARSDQAEAEAIAEISAQTDVEDAGLFDEPEAWMDESVLRDLVRVI